LADRAAFFVGTPNFYGRLSSPPAKPREGREKSYLLTMFIQLFFKAKDE